MYDAGLHIEAINVLFVYIDECANPNNVLLLLNPFQPPITYQSFLESIPLPPPPDILEEGRYLNGGVEIDYRIDILYGNIIYYTLYDELSDERILEITQEFNDGEIIVSINGAPKTYKDYVDFDGCKDSFEKEIESQIDQYLQNKGIEPISEIDDE